MNVNVLNQEKEALDILFNQIPETEFYTSILTRTKILNTYEKYSNISETLPLQPSKVLRELLIRFLRFIDMSIQELDVLLIVGVNNLNKNTFKMPIEQLIDTLVKENIDTSDIYIIERIVSQINNKLPYDLRPKFTPERKINIIKLLNNSIAFNDNLKYLKNDTKQHSAEKYYFTRYGRETFVSNNNNDASNNNNDASNNNNDTSLNNEFLKSLELDYKNIIKDVNLESLREQGYDLQYDNIKNILEKCHGLELKDIKSINELRKVLRKCKKINSDIVNDNEWDNLRNKGYNLLDYQDKVFMEIDAGDYETQLKRFFDERRMKEYRRMLDNKGESSDNTVLAKYIDKYPELHYAPTEKKFYYYDNTSGSLIDIDDLDVIANYIGDSRTPNAKLSAKDKIEFNEMLKEYQIPRDRMDNAVNYLINTDLNINLEEINVDTNDITTTTTDSSNVKSKGKLDSEGKLSSQNNKLNKTKEHNKDNTVFSSVSNFISNNIIYILLFILSIIIIISLFYYFTNNKLNKNSSNLNSNINRSNNLYNNMNNKLKKMKKIKNNNNDFRKL